MTVEKEDVGNKKTGTPMGMRRQQIKFIYNCTLVVIISYCLKRTFLPSTTYRPFLMDEAPTRLPSSV